MSIFDGKFIRGVMGDVVFKKVGNTQRMSRRMAPGTMKQTAATKKAANTFGLSSSLGAQLRDIWRNDTKGFVDSAMSSRLTATVSRIFYQCRDGDTGEFNFNHNSFSGLTGFDFNNRSSLWRSLGVMPIVNVENASIVVLLPSLRNIKFPSFAISCEMTVSIALISLKEGLKAQHPDRKKILIERNAGHINPYQFKFDVPAGCLCVVSIFLDFYMEYKTHIKLINNKQFSPAAICAAVISPGEFAPDDSRFWVEMPGLTQI